MLKQKPKHPPQAGKPDKPDAGWLNRTNKFHGMYYLSHQTLDTDHGIILDVAVTAGDASDKAPYLAQIERVIQLLPIQKATADSAYDCGLVHQVLGEHGVSFAIQKWSQNLTRILRRGLEAAEDHCLLSAMALNLKRIIKCMG